MISDMAYQLYKLPLRLPLRVGGKTLEEREVILLRVRLEDGREGWGEIAPLAGLHREGIDEALAAFQRWKAAHLSKAAHSLEASLLSEARKKGDMMGFAEALRGLSAYAKREGMLPSVYCGVEMALRWAYQDWPFERQAREQQESLPIQSLLVEGREELVAVARKRMQEGYRVFKIKVGRRSVEEDIARIKALRDAFGEGIALRPDANRAWSLTEASVFGKGAQEEALDYVEEPLQSIKELPQLVEETGMVIALDESLYDQAPPLGLYDQAHATAAKEDLQEQGDAFEASPYFSPLGVEPAPLHLFKQAGALILKPMRLGGLGIAEAWGDWAAREGKRVVVSSSFESPFGLALLALWSAQSFQGEAAGLDTARWFVEPREEMAERENPTKDLETRHLWGSKFDGVESGSSFEEGTERKIDAMQDALSMLETRSSWRLEALEEALRLLLA
jgi:o-succinylbenzoate synthase